ncbi:hypothetical protein ACOMHN_016031 [Nucella lapillus]
MASVWEGVGAQISTPASSASPQDIQQEVRAFLAGATCQRGVGGAGLAHSALFLLQRVPAARHAVLQHFCNVFDDAAATYITHLDNTQPELEQTMEVSVSVLQDVSRVLMGFISTSPDAWAPIVSSWSLTLLGQISGRYSKRRVLAMAPSLNDILQLWMTCPPTRLLMELAAQCFAAMVGGAPDSCVDALLEASVQYSPHFDWVVARIGSCYPTAIITRVLNCGLKDFCSAGCGDPGDPDPGVRKKVPKMASVVGILGHLASKHQQDIRKALMALFEEGLQSSGDALRVTTLPFLLQLASMSPMLLQVLTTDLISALTPGVLNRLHHQFLTWTMAGAGDYNSFLNLVVHLLTKCDVGAFDILSFIVSTAAPSDPESSSEEQVLPAVQETCEELIHMLLFELQRGVYGKQREGAGQLALLEGLSGQTQRLVPLLLQAAHTKRLPWLRELLVFTAVRSGHNFSAAVLSQIIVGATTHTQLDQYFRIQESIEKSLPNVAKATLDNLFGSMATSKGPQLVQTLRNLERVVRGEQKRNQALKAAESYLTVSIQRQLYKVCEILQHPDLQVSVAALTLLRSVGVAPATDIAVLSQLSAVIVAVLFRVLSARTHDGDLSGEGTCQVRGPVRRGDLSGVEREGVVLCQACVRQLGCQPFTQSQVLHHLLTGCLGQENRELFGSRAAAAASGEGGGGGGGSLLRENQRIGLSLQLPRHHASVFHAGVVGQGLKRHSPRQPVSKEWAIRNQDSLLEAIAACCQSSQSHTPASPTPVAMETATQGAFNVSTSLIPPILSEAAARTLGCALVEAVTMDTLYNDVNWPDPDFCKVTLERDLHVWKQMEDHPVLWSILRAVSGTLPLDPTGGLAPGPHWRPCPWTPLEALPLDPTRGLEPTGGLAPGPHWRPCPWTPLEALPLDPTRGLEPTGGLAPGPHWRPCPWTPPEALPLDPTGGLAPGPHWRPCSWTPPEALPLDPTRGLALDPTRGLAPGPHQRPCPWTPPEALPVDPTRGLAPGPHQRPYPWTPLEALPLDPTRVFAPGPHQRPCPWTPPEALPLDPIEGLAPGPHQSPCPWTPPEALSLDPIGGLAPGPPP